uniref:Uncharacterized protein n=1 Tax=Cyclophora tenuis TaxID=216820 RepID=A0A7S1D6A9_CYCTE|mmetsp:Transcript_23593/g.40039  ORF Transcript_23593/g.40039 Transcript_23593/m.40039 type:complete len:172 (+) Transcript_23593:186-701(+)
MSWPIARMIEYVYSTAEVGNDESDVQESVKMSREAKPTSALLTCLQLGNFVIDAGDSLSATHLRTLCKLLGGADIDVEYDHPKFLIQLKEIVEELESMVTDRNALESLETMSELLSEFDEDTRKSLESLADELENVCIMEDDKENAARAQSSQKEGVAASPLQRSSFGPIN